ncbi:two-component sensor histidine kinase [Kitasatospora sp. MMS16-BH015]|uniref:sensor histidine kinase n=1 Tax=Kitasatospora sp. MMS16-BH015 TaxID=2018025 RepID=UPI000CA15AF4|nr:histidine kinase [Kitasatospora sp. MMS16-BH015]AUG82032.1 two-component sensor histidine kinase [Kitasatospora sp. MMS16-BH015]
MRHPEPLADPLPGHPVFARLAQLGQRVRQADRARPWALDAAVVGLVVLLFCLPDLFHGGVEGPREHRLHFARLPLGAMLALQAGLVLPLLWRRRRPTAAFAAVMAVFLLQWSLGAALRADVALLFALYSLALHGRLRHLAWACAAMVAAAGLVAVEVSSGLPVGDALFFLGSAATAAVALGIAVRIRRAQLAGLRERAARLEIERDQRSRLAAVTERTRIAREMHDILGHNLSVIVTLADGGAYAAQAAPERGREALLLIGDTSRQALGELRRVLGVLRDQGEENAEFTPQPGLAELDGLCARIRAAGPQVVYSVTGGLAGLDRGVELMAYRIVQESLTNTLKHAGPETRAQVSLTVEGSRLRVRVRDSGPAAASVPAPAEWEPEPAPAREVHEGHGLAGIRERAALYGGTVVAGPAPGGGWAVEAVLALASGTREAADASQAVDGTDTPDTPNVSGTSVPMGSLT